jgi:hypothetical protein
VKHNDVADIDFIELRHCLNRLSRQIHVGLRLQQQHGLAADQPA